MTTTEPKTFRLGSNQMVSAPGIIRWAINGYKFKRDRKKMVNVMKSWDGLTDAQWAKVLTGEIPHTIEGDVVVITITDDPQV